MKKIYYIYPYQSTFVLVDRTFFVENNQLIAETNYNATNYKSEVFKIIRSIYYSFIYVPKVDAVYSFFVGYHTLFPFLLAKFLGKKTICALGGTECHLFPEFKYGSYRKPFYAFFTRKSLALADLILPVDESLIKSEVTYTKTTYPQQGILAFNKELRGKIVALNCGFAFDLDVSKLTQPRRKNSFITASLELSGFDFVRKGIDFILTLAPYFPDAEFTLVGNHFDPTVLIPNNVKIIPVLKPDDLRKLYLEHEFYLQLSIAEGFPNALAEAMLHGCIPIGSSVFGIPYIIQDCGYVLPKKDVSLAIALFKQAMESENKSALSQKAHDRIQSTFTLRNRKEKLDKLIAELW